MTLCINLMSKSHYFLQIDTILVIILFFQLLIIKINYEIIIKSVQSLFIFDLKNFN